MTKYTLIAVLFLGILATSCSKDQKPTYTTEESSGATASETEKAATDSATAAPVSGNNVTVSPSANPAVVNANPVTSTTVPSAAKGAGLNPEHGKPGHRCDIPVGAPLSSTPQAKAPNPANPSAMVPNAVQTMPNPATNVAKPAQKTAPGMNPPHGEPNHRCDIPVGASLSTPVKANPTTAIPSTVAAPDVAK